MQSQPAINHKQSQNAITRDTQKKSSDTLLFIVIFVTALGLTPLLIFAGVDIGFSMLLGLITALALAISLVRWPIIGFLAVAACVALIEQEPLATPIFTDHFYVFYWPPRFTGLIERPIGFFLLYILLVSIFHCIAKRRVILQGGPLLLPFLCYLFCVALGVVHGMTSGGDFKTIVVEVRPFWYMFVSYILAYNLVTQIQHIRAFFWILIIGAGIKGIQGTYIYLVLFHGSLIDHNEIMAHEESFFFIALLLLILLFTLHSRHRGQLVAALLALPCVILALVANQRRADYIALLMGGMIAWMLVFIVKPQARKALLIGMSIFVVVGSVYVAAFWQSTGGFGEPARSLISFFHPDPRDAASNLYRTIENFDLRFTERQNPLLGMGFGKPFLQPFTLPNILVLDPYYLYIPHNTVYWVWMRLGPLGYFAFWYLIGAIIIRGCIIVRQLRNNYLQLVAIYIVAVTFMEVIVAYADYQLFFYRNVIYLGLLVGILLKLPHLDRQTGTQKPVLDAQKEPLAHEIAHGIRELAPSGVGSQRT